MFITRILLLVIGCILITGDDSFDLKLDYYEALIKKGVQDAQNYKPRVDNSDFFENITDTNIYDYGTFDFIIVGAGSSGSVVANRLSENQNWRVLLLEAGGEEDDLSEIPGFHTLLPTSDKNWGYTTTKQRNGCYGMIGGRCPYARGKSIGGSGAINGVLYFRGNKQDYDKWSQWGNPGWSFDNLTHYFKKSENSQVPDAEESYHGFAGPLNSCYTNPESPLIESFIEANEELGLKYIDINAPHVQGVGRMQNTVLFGKRVSGGNTYLKSASNRFNLKITTRALVTKILIEKPTKTAKGVLFVKNGMFYKASAEKEVILSGGAVNTPQILMLSGIGPREELKRHKIEIMKELPVGKTTRDHIAFNHIYYRTNKTTTGKPLRAQLADYLRGFGVLTTSFASKAVSFKKFNQSQIEFILIAPERGIQKIAAPRNYNNDVKETLQSFDGTTDFLIAVVLLQPKSTGRITLKSADPKDFPDIDIGIFSDDYDLEVLYEAINFAYKLKETAAFKKYNATPYFKLKPCEEFGNHTKEFWFCALKYLSFNGYHLSSTARMGPKDDPLAVVDNELRVYGIKNLRIIDCSIMPDTVAGHTNAIAFAIGEKGSDLIKHYYAKDR